MSSAKAGDMGGITLLSTAQGACSGASQRRPDVLVLGLADLALGIAPLGEIERGHSVTLTSATRPPGSAPSLVVW